MATIFRVILTPLAGCIPLVYFLWNNQDIQWSIVGTFSSICYAILGEYSIREKIKALNSISVKKDLQFGLFILEELKLIDIEHTGTLFDKLNKLEELLIGCRSVLDRSHPSYERINTQLATINVWSSTFDNSEDFETKEYKTALKSLRTFIQTELKNVNL